MAHSTAVPAAAPSFAESTADAREQLYKSDHRRGIDRYIDFFGDGMLSDVGDGCGELFLESLA